MHIDIVSAFDDLQSLRDNWNEIYINDPEANYFLSWHWVAGWLERRSQWMVLGAKHDVDDERYVAFFPVQMHVEFEKGTGLVNAIHTSGTPFAVYSGILSLPEWAIAAVEAFGTFLQTFNWRKLVLDDIYMSPHRLQAFLGAFPEQDFSSRKITRRKHITDNGQNIDHDVYVYVKLPTDFEQFLNERLGPKTRRDARRVLRDLGKEFHVTETSAATIKRDLEIFYGMWGAQWGQKQPQEAAYTLENCRRMLAHCHADGTLLVPILWHGEKPVAAQVIFVDRSRHTLVCFLTGRDLELKRPAPGFLLHCYNLRWAIENGFETYDLGTGDFSYKFVFGSGQHIVEKRLVSTRSGHNIGNRVDPHSLGAACRAAAQLAQNGDLKDAALCCRQILDVDPEHAATLRLAAQIKTAQHVPAAEDLATLLDATVGRHRAGDLVAAEAGYREILSVVPGHFAALHQLALVLLQTGDPAGAEAFIHSAVEIRPDAALAHFAYGNILATLGKYEAALVRYDRAIMLNPHFVAAFNNRGTVLRRVGRQAEAVESFVGALAIDPGNRQAEMSLSAMRTDVVNANALALATP